MLNVLEDAKLKKQHAKSERNFRAEASFETGFFTVDPRRRPKGLVGDDPILVAGCLTFL